MESGTAQLSWPKKGTVSRQTTSSAPRGPGAREEHSEHCGASPPHIWDINTSALWLANVTRTVIGSYVRDSRMRKWVHHTCAHTYALDHTGGFAFCPFAPSRLAFRSNSVIAFSAFSGCGLSRALQPVSKWSLLCGLSFYSSLLSFLAHVVSPSLARFSWCICHVDDMALPCYILASFFP